jgi:probable phosphoglycerate mutase
LVRHGETAWNREERWQGHTDVGLNEEGLRQAKLVAERIRAEQGSAIEAVYTSPLARAARTAEIIAGALRLTPLEDARLQEMDIGAWSGLTTAEVVARFADEWNRIRAGEDLPRGGGGETFAAFQARVVRGLEGLIRGPGPSKIVVVTHGGPIRALLLHWRRLPPSRLREVERIANASLTEVVLGGDGGPLLCRVNDTRHLRAGGEEEDGLGPRRE